MRTIAALIKRSLPLKILGAIISAILVVVPLVGYHAVNQVQSALESAHLEKALTTARLLDASIQSLQETENSNALFEKIQRHLWLEPDILAIDINIATKEQLSVVVASDSRRVGTASSQENYQSYHQDILVTRLIEGGQGRFLRIITPIHIAKGRLGTFQIDFSLELVDQQVATTLSALINGYIAIIIATITLGFLSLRHIVLTPLAALDRGLKAISRGRLDYQIDVTGEDEIGRLASSFNGMGSDLLQSSEKANFLAFHDALTGLPNRRILLDRLEMSVARCIRDRRQGALLYLDIDHFKDINDSFGHNTGDRLLTVVATRIKEHLRETDTVVRMGGDELVVLVAESDRDIHKEALAVAQKISEELAREIRIDDHRLMMTVSIGLCLFPENEGNVSGIIRKADTALYYAKRRGRNKIVTFSSDMQVKQERRSMMRRELKRAVSGSEFLLAYQPQVNEQGRLIGVEALIRWNHPQRGLISPDQFIPIAEESDLICEIGEWVLRTACAEYCRWLTAGMDRSVTLGVNVSPRQFHSAGFVDTVERLLSETQMNPGQLDLEVTETTLMTDSEGVIQKMKQLRALGVRFSLDDFGTGYSSLAYLKQLPVSRLKIDRAFIRDVCVDTDNTAIVETILSVAQQYRLEVVSEGVETEDQLKCLAERGCEIYQGYYFDRPLTPEQFAESHLGNPAIPLTAGHL